MSNLDNLFNLLLETVKLSRKNNQNFDGLSYWRKIKVLLSEDLKASKWKHIPKKLTYDILSFPEQIVFGNGKTETIENNHFIIQQVRIPKKDEPNLRKIMQIALNIGQWEGFPNQDIYNLVNYPKTKLNKLSTYITEVDNKIISKQIDQQLYEQIKQAILN